MGSSCSLFIPYTHTFSLSSSFSHSKEMKRATFFVVPFDFHLKVKLPGPLPNKRERAANKIYDSISKLKK